MSSPIRTLARRIYPERFAALKSNRGAGDGPRWYLVSPWLRRLVKAGEHRGNRYVRRFLGRSWRPFGGR